MEVARRADVVVCFLGLPPSYESAGYARDHLALPADPLAAARVLADLGLDTTTLQAALLHDTVEDTDVTVEDPEREVAGL